MMFLRLVQQMFFIFDVAIKKTIVTKKLLLFFVPTATIFLKFHLLCFSFKISIPICKHFFLNFIIIIIQFRQVLCGLCM